MVENEGLYPHIEKTFENSKKRLQDNPKVLEENKKLLLEFLDTKLAADRASIHQKVSYLARLVPIAELLGNRSFKNATRKDMERAIGIWRGSKVRGGKEYGPASFNKMQECLKSFLRWVYGLTSQDPAPESVKWIRPEQIIGKIRAEDLITEDEIARMIYHTKSPMYKLMIRVQAESGCRPGEIRALKIGDVKFVDDMARLYVKGKTRRLTGERTIPLVRCVTDLREWINSHPRKQDQNAWLWSYTKKPIPERNYSIHLTRVARKAGINKHMNAYRIRHSRLTRIYKELPSNVGRRLAGHIAASRSVDTYLHLSSSDLDDAVRQLNGVPFKKANPDTSICPNCNTILPIGALKCGKCNEKLSTKSAAELDERQQIMLRAMENLIEIGEKHPEILDPLKRLLGKKILNTQ